MALAKRNGHDSADTSSTIEEAVDRWGRQIFGAPRNLSSLITKVEVRDEVLERIAIDVARREICEQRLPTNERQLSTPRIDPRSVDPFELTLAELRARSEHVAPCQYCNGAGSCACYLCGGAQRAACANCGGSGKTVKYYKTTTRVINCKGCRGSGTVKCSGCGAKGTVTCRSCSGSGHQLAWLAYQETSYWRVVVAPDSLVTRAHGQLTEERFLGPADLEAFAVIVAAKGDSELTFDGYRESDMGLLRATTNQVDQRIERIRRQQYLRLSVVRRDVSFELCGSAMKLVLSGRDLEPSTTLASTRLFHRRLYFWGTSGALIAGSVAVLGKRLLGISPYFHASNAIIVGFGVAAFMALTLGIGGLLRALRVGWRLGALQRMERTSLLAGGACLLLMIATRLIAQPREGDVKRALATADVQRARLVADAMLESAGSDSGDVANVRDDVSLAEASFLSGDQRLAALDRIAARNGRRSAEAAQLARGERLARIKTDVDGHQPTSALSEIDKWWPSWRADSEVAEARAHAYDVASGQCTNAPCRLRQAQLAVDAAPSDARRRASALARSDVLAALTTADAPNETILARIQRLDALSATAKDASTLADKDEELSGAAKKTGDWSESEREKIPALGAELPVVEALLGAKSVEMNRLPSVQLGGQRAFLVLDTAKRCRGIYIVGNNPDSRALTQSTADKVLSQAAGHRTMVKHAPGTSTTAQWYEMNAMVTARWKGSDLIEVRIGNAAP